MENIVKILCEYLTYIDTLILSKTSKLIRNKISNRYLNFDKLLEEHIISIYSSDFYNFIKEHKVSLALSQKYLFSSNLTIISEYHLLPITEKLFYRIRYDIESNYKFTVYLEHSECFKCVAVDVDTRTILSNNNKLILLNILYLHGFDMIYDWNKLYIRY
jgi:hypothetical protein